MQETLASFKTELDSIETVLNKLVTKQNSTVFDKLCIKCNILFENISALDSKTLKKEDISSLIEHLKRLRSICSQLSAYKEYLITVINNNIMALQAMEKEKSNIQENKKLEYMNAERKDAA